MNGKIEYLKTKIAEELRKLRAEKKLSQEAVIDGINELNKRENQEELSKNAINIGTLVRYENGTVLQSLDKLTMILEFYGVELDYFFKLIYENMYRNKED